MVFYLLGGLALFLGGLKVMSNGLEKMYGSSLNSAVPLLTGNRWKAFFFGFLLTGLTQSSSLVTVVVVGMADAGIIGLRAAIAVIIGANVGTTITGQLLAFDITDFALPLVCGGMALLMAPVQTRVKEAGLAVCGLGVLLYGLYTMGLALVPLSKTEWVSSLLFISAAHPKAGILAGAAVTALIQSSSAVAGIALALAREGVITLASGVAIVAGADVGTCVTSLLAGLGTNLTARRVAVAHLLFNIISVIVIMPFFNLFVMLAARTADSVPRQLANAHTLYNAGGAVLLLIFLTPFQFLTEYLIKAENPPKKRISDFISEIISKKF